MVAIKHINPIPFKLLATALVARSVVLRPVRAAPRPAPAQSAHTII